MTNITITEESLPRCHKRLQKALKSQGSDLPLHMVSDIFAQTLGQKNTHDLQSLLKSVGQDEINLGKLGHQPEQVEGLLAIKEKLAKTYFEEEMRLLDPRIVNGRRLKAILAEAQRLMNKTKLKFVFFDVYEDESGSLYPDHLCLSFHDYEDVVSKKVDLGKSGIDCKDNGIQGFMDDTYHEYADKIKSGEYPFEDETRKMLKDHPEDIEALSELVYFFGTHKYTLAECFTDCDDNIVIQPDNIFYNIRYPENAGLPPNPPKLRRKAINVKVKIVKKIKC